MQLHHPFGKIIDETPESGADKIGDGLFGYFPMTTPLVNIVTPTYLSENTNYNYSLDRVANPTRTTDISDKLRWENSSKAIKGNVGMKVSNTVTSYEQCPKFVPINYGCENAFSLSVIINKHGNFPMSISGETAIFLKFGSNLLKVSITDYLVKCEYGSHSSGFNLLNPASFTSESKLNQIEHITITYKRTSFNTSIIKVYDSACTEIVAMNIGDLFKEEVYLYTSGNNEITNMRTYFIELPLNVIKNICFMGDFKSKIFVSDDDFSFEYDWNNAKITSKNTSFEKYPYGSCRTFAVGNERLGVSNTLLSGVLGSITAMNPESPKYVADIVPKKERFANKNTTTDSANYAYSIATNTDIDMDLSERLGYINIDYGTFSIPLARAELWKIINRNTPYIMSIMHYGYFFVRKDYPDEEFFKRIEVDFTGIPWADIKAQTDKKLVIFSNHSSPSDKAFGSNDEVVTGGSGICIHNMTDNDVLIGKYVYPKSFRMYTSQATVTVPPYSGTPFYYHLPSDIEDTSVFDYDDGASILLLAYDTSLRAICSKILDTQKQYTIQKPLCMLESVGDDIGNMGAENGALCYTLEGTPTFFENTPTSKHYEFRQGGFSSVPSGIENTIIRNMISDNEFPKYQKSLTKIEQIKYSGKCMASSIVELNFGIYNDIKYLFSPYCNIKATYNTNTYTLSTEQWTGIEEHNRVENSLVSKNVLFTISNTELLNTRIVANISNNVNDLVASYNVDDLIPSLNNYNLIKIGASRYVYSSPLGYKILYLSEEVGGFRYGGYSNIDTSFRQSSLSLSTNVSEIILYKGTGADSNVIIIGDLEGYSTCRSFDEPLCPMNEIVIKANNIYEICQYSKDIEQYILYVNEGNRLKLPHVYFLPKPESYNIFPTKDTLKLYDFTYQTSAIKNSFFRIGDSYRSQASPSTYFGIDYRFNEKNSSAMVNRVYGVNRFIDTVYIGSTSGPTYGYGVHVGDAENGSLDTSLWRLETTVSGLSSAIAQASKYSTSGKTDSFIFELEHLKSVARKTPSFDIVEFCNNFPTLNNATLRVRNPITKESYKYDNIYFQSPEISYADDDVKEIIDVPYQRYVYKNERSLPSTKFCDTSVNEPTISNEAYVPFGSENRIILAGDGLGYGSPNKHPDGTSITLYSAGYIYSYFIVVKKELISNEIHLQDDDTNFLYKTSEIGEVKLKNGVDINTFPENAMSYDMTPLIPIDGTSKVFDVYGFKENHNCGYPFQIERDGISNIEESNIVVKSEPLGKYPALHTGDITLFSDSTKHANNVYIPLHDIFLGLSQGEVYTYSKFTNSRKKSWVSQIGVNSGITIRDPAIDSDRELIITVSTGTVARIIEGTSVLPFSAGAYDIESLYNGFILGYVRSADKTRLSIEMATFSNTEEVKAVQDGAHSFSLEKAHSLDTPISNGITYTDNYSYFVKTHNYTQPIENGFLLEGVKEDSISFSFKNKRHLDQISVRIDRSPQGGNIQGIKTNAIISSVYPNNKVSIERADVEYSIHNPDDAKNILVSDSKALVMESADAKLKLRSSLDNYYRYTVSDPDPAVNSTMTKDKIDTYTETIRKTGTRNIIVYSLTPDGTSSDIYGNYANKYTLSLQCEVLKYTRRAIEIRRNTISYSTSSEFSVKFYKETDTGDSQIIPAKTNTIASSDLGDQNEISSLKINDILETSTYFGKNVTINKISIPYNDAEIFRIPSDSALMYYDFYGKSYKQYNKLNLIDACTVSENRTNQKIGVQSDLIEISDVMVCNNSEWDTVTARTKEISFLIKYDNLNILTSSSDAFTIRLGNLNLFDELILDKTYDGWRYILIRFDDTDYTVFAYDAAGTPHEIKPASPHSFPSMPFAWKLSISNTRWAICDLEIRNKSSDSVSDEARVSGFGRLHYENSIQVVDGKYQIPDGKYLYSESPIPVSKHEINLDFINGTTTPPDFLYGKLQNVYGRASKYPLILFDEVYSYRNVPDNNKLTTQNEEEISESPLNVSFDIFVQKLGATELNNPVMFVNKVSEGVWSYKSPPQDSSELLYVACLISDDTYDTLEMASFMEYDSYSYNKNLPETHTYINQKAILGRQIVMIDSIEGKYIYNHRTYRVVKVSPIDKQRFFPSHIEGEWIRNVYDFSSITESYEFNDNMVDAESDIYKPSRASGSLILRDDIYKFNKFGNRVEKYSVDKGCAVYLFEGHIDNPILQSTLFIDTIVTNTKEDSIQISLKNKVDLIYDKKIINYKTFENVGIKEIIGQALFPYFYVLDGMVTFSASLFYCESLPPSIKTINFSSFNTIGEIFDAICSCGFNIWIDELERIIIDTDVFTKLMHEGKKVEYENGYNSAFKDGIRDAGNLSIDNINDLTDDIVISEKDGLIVNKIELAHENLVPMYDRSEYVKGDKIYPVNNIGLDIATSDTVDGSIVYFDSDKTELIKPSLLTAYKTIPDFNKLKMKTGVMCVVRRDGYELQYKFIQAKKESV